MSQPVKLSKNLVGDARIIAKLEDRSIAGQIEFWAQLGRALEPLLQGAQVLALRKAGDVQPLSACLRSVNTAEGRRRLAGHLAGLPFPHYEPHSELPGLVVRIDADRKRTVGRFVGRQFKAVR